MKRLLPTILVTAILSIPPGAAQRGPSALAADGPMPLRASLPAQPGYTVADLGTLGGPMSQGMGTNDDGQVVGGSQSGSQSFGFLWDGATMANLGDLSGRGSWAYDVNDAGQVVGGSYVNEQFHSHAFRWQNGSMQDLAHGGRSASGQRLRAAVGCMCAGHLLSRPLGTGGVMDQ
jgi:probable HAF family extracellular repeat protein